MRDILAELTNTLDDVLNSAADAATIAPLSQQINYAESWLGSE